MKQGFTLIELMIVVGLIGSLFITTAVNYGKYNRKKIVEKEAQELITDLRHAQSKALTGEKPSACDSDHYLEKFILRFTSNRDYRILAVCFGGIEADVKTGLGLGDSVVKQSGPNEIIFKLLGHGVTNAGTIRLSGYAGQWFYNLSVSATGEITDEGFE